MTDVPGKPVVTVVIPTYMRADGVARALDSIDEPALSSSDIQVVVVDNASTDRTADVVEARRERFDNLVYRRWDSNVGPIENWRRGVALAEAPWLHIVWSDDCLTRGALTMMIAAADRNNATVVTSRVAIDYPDGRSVTRYLDHPSLLTPDIVASELLHFPAGLPSSPGAALVRTADARAALDHQLPTPCMSRAIGPDLLITYWAVFHGGVGVHQPDVLARFSASEDSITVRTKRAVLSSCYGAALDHLISLSPTPVSPTTLRRLRSRAAIDAMLGGEPEALISPRRLSGRATVYDTYQLSRHWFTTHVLGRQSI